MPEYLSPGVYTEEIDTGSKPIEGVSTSTAGMVGVAERGPVNVPILITGYGEYTRWFGGRLPISDFRNANGPHCYMPHAVEGFFTNGGQRLYVTRVLDLEGAQRAAAAMFDRGTPTSAQAVLLRAAPEARGTAATPPWLYVLDTTHLAHGNWIRIGNGSNAEYRQADVVGAGPGGASTHVALDSPLSRAHDSGKTVEEFARAPAPGYVGPIRVITPLDSSTNTHLPLRRGAVTVVVTSATAADLTTLAGAVTPLLEIGAAAYREFRFVTQAQRTASDQVTLHLDAALALPHRHNEQVTPLLVATPVIQAATLDTAVNAGDEMLFLDDLQGQFANTDHLVVIDRADASHREVRRIGALFSVTLSTGAYGDYPAGSLAEKVTLADDARSLTAPAAGGDTSVKVDDVRALAVGQRVLVGAGLNPEAMVVKSITPDQTTPPHGTVGLTSPLAAGHFSGHPFRPAAKSLTASANAGQGIIVLDDRLGLSEKDLLRVGAAPAEEFVQIQALPNRATAPDAGNVLLTHPLSLPHSAGTPVWRETEAPVTPPPPTVTALDAGPGDTTLLLTDGGALAANDVVRITTSTDETFRHRLSASTQILHANLVSIEQPALEHAHSTGSVVVGRDPLFTVEALDAGAWGDRLRISIEDETPGLVSRTTLSAVTNPTHVRLGSVAGVEAGTILELLDPLSGNAVVGDPLKVVSIDRATNYTVVLAGGGLSAGQLAAQTAAAAAGTQLGVRSREFRLTVLLLHKPDPALPSRNEIVIDSEVFRNLSMDPRHSRYIQTVIGDINGPLRLSDRRPEGESWYVRVHDLAQDLPEPARTQALESTRLGPEALVDILPSGRERPARRTLEGGDDSVATLGDGTYIGADSINPEQRTGLYTLVNIDEISIVAVPGRTGAAIQGALIDHCELMRYRFAVLDGSLPPHDSLSDVQQQRQQFDTKYAALYHPWMLIEDPFPTNLAKISEFAIPPSGHVVGVYARTDIDRGVHKAPANEVVRGILGLQRILNKAEQDILNPFPVNINVIRDFRLDNRSIRVWGGRVITSDTDWKYVNVRRLLIFIEKSIDRGLQWVVFEPNAEPLWARVRRTISNFLTTVWRNGALEGTKPEEAYFVKCDRTTMTQTDIDNGRLIVVIGVAPVKPAEFVIIRIGLWTAHAET